MRTTGTLLALVALAAAPLAAQGFFLAGEGGYFDATGITRSLNALAGSSRFPTFGIESGWVFRRGLYASAGGAFFPDKEGERVFVAVPAAPVFKLGFPLTLKRRAAFLNVGWRFLTKKRFMPYAAVGGELVSLEETSDVAGEVLADSQTKGGFRFLAGLEWKAAGSLHFGVEAIGSTVPRAVGVGGVSEVYGEDDIGGLTVLAKVIWSPTRKAPAKSRADPR